MKLIHILTVWEMNAGSAEEACYGNSKPAEGLPGAAVPALQRGVPHRLCGGPRQAALTAGAAAR